MEEERTDVIARMEGVREYSEGATVELSVGNGRIVARAYNQAGYDCTEIDLLDLLAWCRENADNIKALVASLTEGPPQGIYNGVYRLTPQ